MQEEVQWFANQVTQFDESLRSFGWHFDELEEARRELGALWSDSCAREVAARLLDPHGRDTADALTQIADQLQQLGSTERATRHSYDDYARACTLATQLEQRMEEGELRCRALDQLVAETAREATSAQHHAQRAAEFVKRADELGG